METSKIKLPAKSAALPKGVQGVLDTPPYFKINLKASPPLSFSLPQRPRILQGRPQNEGYSAMLGVFFRFFGLPKRSWKNASKKHRKKCENRRLGLPQTLPKSSQNAFKIAFPKNMRFCIDFWWIFVASCKSRTLKFVRPRSVS